MTAERSPGATHRDTWREENLEPASYPGVVLAFQIDRPSCNPLPLDEGALTLGRVAPLKLADERVSREHARVLFDGERWSVEDLGSSNGTWVDGARVESRQAFAAPRVLRLGRCVYVFTSDVTRFVGTRLGHPTTPVMGAALAAAWGRVSLSARSGDRIHLRGESGSGKELAARAFHGAGPRPRGPFVAVNCAAIPETLAESLLFGARKGSFSGASSDSEGYIVAADGGTLFLDEIAELPLPVQAKLLRVIETREVLALGATKPRAVDVGLVTATHRDLRDAVGRAEFREDLYFRLGKPEVAIPPLRDRLEEIPFFIERALGGAPPSAPFVEACLLRHWPGNVRELIAEVQRAGQEASLRGSPSVELRDLDPRAGTALVHAEQHDEQPDDEPSRSSAEILADEARVQEALLTHEGNVTAAARALGLHRNQLRRWLERRRASDE